MKFIQTSEEFGDCSAFYDVTLDNPHTVGDFINRVLVERKGKENGVGSRFIIQMLVGWTMNNTNTDMEL